MAFDPHGRVWVALRGRDGAEASGSILIVEDRDGDGRADRTTIFADGLWRPSGLAIGPAGAYVASGSELLLLADRDGDDRADAKRVLLDGFESWHPEDVLQGLRLGPDGGLRMTIGPRSETAVETASGVVRVEGAAALTFWPLAGRLDVTEALGDGPPAPSALDRWGRDVRRRPGSVGLPPSGSAGVLGGPAWPEGLRGMLAVAEHDDAGRARIGLYRLRDAGSLLKGEAGAPLLTAMSDRTRIVDLSQSSDGSLYLATTDAIWSLAPGDRPAPGVEGAETATPQTAPADEEDEHHRLEGLWASDQAGRFDVEILNALLHSPEPHARAAATRFLRDHRDRVPDLLDQLAVLVVDPSPLVRLEAVAALGQIPGPRAVELATAALEHPWDSALDEALHRAITARRSTWLPALEAGELRCGGHPGRIEAVLRAAPTGAALRALSRLVRDESLTSPAKARLLALTAELGTPVDLSEVLDRLARLPNPADRTLVLKALARSVRVRQFRLDASSQAPLDLLRDRDDGVKAETARLIGAAKLGRARHELALMASDPLGDVFLRLAAIEGLAELGAGADQAALKALAGNENPAPVRVAATAALAPLDLDAAATCGVEILCSSDAYRADPAPLLRALIRQESGAVLARMLADRALPADIARQALRVLYFEGRPRSALEARLRNAAGLAPQPKPPTDAEVARLAAEVRSRGDRARGEVVLVRPDVGCLQCHSLRGAGGASGPALDRLLPAPTVESLIRSIRDPARHVSKQPGAPMPAGLADLMTLSDLIDLVRFLSEAHRDDMPSTGSDPIVRCWQVLDPVPSYLASAAPEALAVRLDGDAHSWTTVYSVSSGVLPAASFAPSPRQPVGFVRCAIDAAIPGEVGLRIEDPRGVTLLLDDRPVPLGGDPLHLDYGVHVLTFRIDRRVRGPGGLRVELVPVSGSPCEARLAAGRVNMDPHPVPEPGGGPVRR
jgi:mono/diheme cytochrome c family protein